MRLGRVINRYLAHQTSTGVLSPATAKHRRSALRRFEAHCGQIDVDKVGRKAVETWLAKSGRTPATKRYYLSVIRAFARWCVEHELARRDFTLGVRRPRLPRRIPRALSAEQVRRILLGGPDERMLLCLVLALQEGLRVSEITKLETGDIDRAHRTMSIRGKGGHERVLPISEETWACLTGYLGKNHWPGGAVIKSKHDGVSGLTPHTLSMQMSAYIHAAGVDASAHPLRHTAASDVLNQCGDVVAVKDMLGHSTIAVTQVYLRNTNGARLREAMSGRRYGNQV